jgi:hypothetical protein
MFMEKIQPAGSCCSWVLDHGQSDGQLLQVLPALLHTLQSGHTKYVGAVAYAEPKLLPDMANGAIISGQQVPAASLALSLASYWQGQCIGKGHHVLDVSAAPVMARHRCHTFVGICSYHGWQWGSCCVTMGLTSTL